MGQIVMKSMLEISDYGFVIERLNDWRINKVLEKWRSIEQIPNTQQLTANIQTPASKKKANFHLESQPLIECFANLSYTMHHLEQFAAE